MKKTIMTILLIAVYISVYGQQSTSLSYDDEETVKFKLPNISQMNDLSHVDKSILTESSYKTSTKLIIDDQEYSKEITFISHVNKFPSWYNHPTLKVINKSGITNYISTGKNGNLNSHTTPASSKSLKAFELLESQLITNGIDLFLKYNKPNSRHINTMKENGYTFTINNNMWQFQKTGHTLIYNLLDKTINHYYYEGNTLVRDVSIFYSNNNDMGEDYIIKQIEKDHDQFSNGSCYSTITTTVYSNYHNDNVAPLISNVEDTNTDIDFVIAPNPASTEIKVEIAKEWNNGKLEILNMAGEQLIFRKIANGVKEMRLNIHDFADGVYLVKLSNHSKSKTSKFIKIK